MKFLSIHIEGFCSIIGKIKYKWDRPGINLIIGKNGHGKTTIFNALAYCCYGKTLKPNSSILPWPKIIDDGYSGLKVRVKLEDDLEIIRCQEYKGKVMGRAGGNRLVIIHHGKELQNLRNKSDAQQFIDEHLGYSWSLFKSAVLFPQELNSILEEDGPTKKRVFDEAFASAFINQAKKKVELELDNLNKDHETKSITLHARDQMLETNRALLEQVREANKKFATEKARQIKLLRGLVRDAQDKKKALVKKYNPDKTKPEIKQSLKELDDHYHDIAAGVDDRASADEFQLMLDITRYTEEIDAIWSEMEILKKIKTKKCDSCGQSLRGDALNEFRQNIRSKYSKKKKERGNLELKLNSVTKRHELCLKVIKEQGEAEGILKDIKRQIEAKKSELDHLAGIISKIKVLKSEIKNYKIEISRVRKNVQKTDTTKLEADIGTLSDETLLLSMDIGDLQGKIDIHRWLIKDPLSNSGLKAYIFESMLRRVNHFLKHYTKFIGFEAKVGINLESSNKDFVLSITQDKEEVPFEDLSKGQKQLTKVAVCFALNKTMQISKPINILVLDELFESLDEDNIEIVGNIIMDEAKTRSVHLITHHQKFQPLNCYKTFVSLNSKKQTVIEQKYREA